MFDRLLAIRTDDLDLAIRGRMLKIVVVLVMVAAISYLPVAFTNPEIPMGLPWILFGFILLCIGIFAAAHYGYVAQGGLLLALLLMLLLGVAEPIRLHEGTIGFAFMVPIILGGLIFGSRGILAFGAVSIAIKLIIAAGLDLPWSIPAIDGMLLLVMLTGLLWLLLHMVEHILQDTRAKTAWALAARSELSTREQALQQVNQELSKSYDEVKDLLDLVRDLETPVIPLLEGVLVLPLVGHLDKRRADQITHTTLDAVYQQRARTVIVDITGVSVIDTYVAKRILELAHAIKLLGSKVILTGIKSDVAQTLVDLGLNFTGLQTAGRLQDGVATVLEKLSEDATAQALSN